VIARSDQPGLRLAADAGRRAAPTPVAPWASAELLERARRCFSRLYGRPVSIDETRGMLDVAGRAGGLSQEVR